MYNFGGQKKKGKTLCNTTWLTTPLIIHITCHWSKQCGWHSQCLEIHATSYIWLNTLTKIEKRAKHLWKKRTQYE